MELHDYIDKDGIIFSLYTLYVPFNTDTNWQ